MATEFDTKLMMWEKAATELASLKARELELRSEIFTTVFPTAKLGVNNLPLGGGYELKATRKLNYNLKNTAEGLETEKALDAIELLGNEGKFIADRLVKWKPELSLTEYKTLDGSVDPTTGKPNNLTHYQIKALIDAVLTVTDAAPTMEIVKPKR